MDRSYDFLAIRRVATLPLALSGAGAATALAEALFPMRRDEAFGAGGPDMPPRPASRGVASDAGRSRVWFAPCAVRAAGGA